MYRKINIMVLLVVLTAIVAMPVTAREFADIYTECGLGAMIAPRNATVAAITNVTWDLGTTAISSNISSPESCKGGQEKVAAFINDAYDDIAADLARGEGAYLNLLVEMAGNDGTAGAELVDALRQGLANAVSSPDYESMTKFEKAEAMYDMVYSSAQG